MTDHPKTRFCPKIYAFGCGFILKILLLVFVLFPRGVEARPFERSTLGLGAGLAGILDGHKILLGSLEFRPAFESFHLRPWVGMEFGYDLYYLAGGILTNLHISERNIFIPSFGVGFYSTHNGIELGSHMEFRSAAELSHVFKNHSVLGIQFGHISNGGLSSKNPGSEILKLIYYIPL